MASIIETYWPLLLKSLGQTLLLTFISLLFAFFIGLLFGLMNVSKSKILNVLGVIYVDGIRGVPLIVLAFFIYFGIPALIQRLWNPSFTLSALAAGIISLSMNAGAYMAEIFRAGILSVDKGQMEAARSLGLPYGISMRKVVLPQAIRTMVPAIISQFIISLKDTSILSVIGFPELTKAGNIIVGNTFAALEVWGIVAVLYLIVILSLSRYAKGLERRLNVGKE